MTRWLLQLETMASPAGPAVSSFGAAALLGLVAAVVWRRLRSLATGDAA